MRLVAGWALASALWTVLAAAQTVPRPAPELVIRLPRGGELLLTAYRGKVVALEFLHTTCVHCQTCSTLLNNMYKEYGPRGFQPLGVAFNDYAALLVPEYIKQLRLDFPVGFAPSEEVVRYIQLPPTVKFFVPQLLFIDRKGTIRAHYPGGHEFFKDEEANMRKQIETLLKESEKATPAKRSGKKRG